MDCPHCKARNPAGAASCEVCHGSLSSASTAVAELTPAEQIGAATIIGETLVPPGNPAEADATLIGAPGSATAGPSVWSVPTTGQNSGVVQVVPATLLPGALLGSRYEIIGTLGQGGMGAVYKARDLELDRTVALKVIRPEFAGQPEILQRFKQELILARKVTHRNVIRIFDLGEASGIKFITMDFIDGHDLKSMLVSEGKLAPDRAVGIILQVCLALEAAHSEGVVHRDLKPQNIMIDRQGRVSVMDFGIARSVEFGGMTQTGALIGTPEYMSPEQVKGEHVDARSDLFTLGIIIQELLVGKLPFQAPTAMASMYKRTSERAVPVRQLDPSVPAYLSEIVAKCLEIDPNARFQSARELHDALGGWQKGSGATVRLRTVRWLRKAQRGWRWVAAGAALVVLGTSAFVLRSRLTLKPVTAHAPVTVLVADFTNHTGDPIFDGTLEPMFNVALEGATFVNAFSRGSARSLAQKLPNPTDKLDEQPARLVAVSQGINAVITGEISRRGDKYSLSATALDATSGDVIAQTELTAGNKDEVLLTIPKLAAPIRKALGDATPESVQLDATRGAFTAASLEAVHQYSLGMDQQFAGKLEGALQSFSKAVEMDPNFGRAYAGMAAAYGNLGQRQESEKYIKLAMEHVDRMTERERYRIRGQYYYRTGDWQNCVQEYGEYVKQYTADNVAQDLLAICFDRLHNIPRAMEEARRAVQIAPKDLLARMNFALFACYSGDFQSCDREGHEAQKLNPSLEESYLVLAYAQLGQGQLPQAAKIYEELQKVSERGASLAAFGLANLALYEGRYRQGIQILEKSSATDVAAKKPERAADDFAMLSSAELLRGDEQAALADAEKALANSQSEKIRFLAARSFVEAGETAKARKLAATLGSELLADPQAYSKLIDGEAALKEHETQRALQSLTEAKNLLDNWIVHLDLGLVYLEAGAFAEADSEFDRCLKRRGEAFEFFDDDMPTYSYLPAVYYYQGRVREGLKSPGFADSYRTYQSIRGQAGEDPLLPEIRKRLGQ